MQQINLLQIEASSKSTGFSLQKLAIATITLATVLAATSLVQNWRQDQKLAVKKQLQINLEKINLSIQNISSQLQTATNSAELKRTLSTKEKELRSKMKVMNVLSESEAGNTQGFAEHFAGLSRQHVDGLWITNLSILSGGTQLNLQGGSLAPEYVPQYLQRLGNEKSFQGLEFKHFVLERDKSNQQLDFSVYSRIKENS